MAGSYRSQVLGVLGLSLSIGLLGCSSEGGVELAGDPGGGSTGAQGGPQGGSSNGTPTGGTPGDGFSIPSMSGTMSGGGGGAAMNTNGDAYACLRNADSACAGDLYMGQGLPLDIYIMFDQSGSMYTKDDNVTTRMDAVRNAVGQFLHAQESQGMGAGIGYFGHQPLDCACTSCNPVDYSKPSVGLGLLPEHAGAVMGSLSKIEPAGETPTGAAIRGACMYTQARKQANANRNVVILLVTDGEPKAPLTTQKGGCNPTLEDATVAAAECLNAGIRTYVLGIGPLLENLNMIASAGGTRNAYLVANGAVPEILKALNSIRKDATIPCELQIPSPAGSAKIDYQKVNIVYSDSSCSVTTFLYVKEPGMCHPQNGGWYYDNPEQPGQLRLCQASCNQVKAPGGQLAVTVGCMTKIIP
jgi:hypothetical protein